MYDITVHTIWYMYSVLYNSMVYVESNSKVYVLAIEIVYTKLYNGVMFDFQFLNFELKPRYKPFLKLILLLSIAHYPLRGEKVAAK